MPLHRLVQRGLLIVDRGYRSAGHRFDGHRQVGDQWAWRDVNGTAVFIYELIQGMVGKSQIRWTALLTMTKFRLTGNNFVIKLQI